MGENGTPLPSWIRVALTRRSVYCSLDWAVLVRVLATDVACWFTSLTQCVACENRRPSSLPAREAFRHSGRERRRTAVFAGYTVSPSFCVFNSQIPANLVLGVTPWCTSIPLQRGVEILLFVSFYGNQIFSLTGHNARMRTLPTISISLNKTSFESNY